MNVNDTKVVETTATKSVFDTLSNIDCSDKVEKKNGLSYLSWAYAWGELLKKYPDSTYKVYENKEGLNYFHDGKTCWVKTGVTVNGIEHIEYLPVMDYRNKSIPLNSVTSFDVNKTIQRSITKAIARHGLGLYIYAGEDLPDDTSQEQSTNSQKTNTNQSNQNQNNNANYNSSVKRITELCLLVEQYINSGILQGEYKKKAEWNMQNRNLQALEQTVAWCQEQEQKEG